jgi:uncharacterized protein YcbX
LQQQEVSTKFGRQLEQLLQLAEQDGYINLQQRTAAACDYFIQLLDQTLAIGEARLKVVKRIVRCAAINVDPETAERDLNIPPALMRHLGHNECGIYAEVIADGTIATGDAVTISSSA